jgi:hypothetical protein
MAKELLETIAYEKGLEYIETTTGMNGYPQHLRGAIIGFETFAEAEEVAKEHGLRITTFYKRDGWQLYKRDSNTTYGPMNVTSDDYGDDYKHFTNGISQEDFIEEELLPDLAATTFGDIITITNRYEELFDKIVEAEDDELVIASTFGEYVETIKKELMSWSHDSKIWVIGVMEEDE